LAVDWRLLDYYALDPYRTQAIYHAVGLAVDKGIAPNTIIFCKPSSPLVCIGYHQELYREVEVNYCRKKSLPLVRRILGGGAVYLDNDQLFYQIIAHNSDPRVPRNVESLFYRFLEAPVKTYNDIGVSAQYKAVNDIEVRGRKISGNGAGEIGDVSILTGNIIFDFNFDEMIRILKVPSEKFRNKLSNSLNERMTTIKKELDIVPDEEHVRAILKENYQKTLKINLVNRELSEAELALVDEVEEKYKRKTWFNMIEDRHKDLIQKRNLKVTGRTKIGEAAYKAEGGLIRVLIEISDERIKEVMITGDFWFSPRQYLEELERLLNGTSLERSVIIDRINRFYNHHRIQSPLVTPKDIAETIIRASE
jgi:lipoate-protein ligase A